MGKGDERVDHKGDERVDHKMGNVTNKLTWGEILSLVGNQRNENVSISSKRSTIFSLMGQ